MFSFGITTTITFVIGRLLEQLRREEVDRRGTRSLAEADDDRVVAQRMHVPALERVVVPALGRAVVQNSLVRQQRMVQKEQLHDQLFRPAHGVAHRADHDVIADDHRRVAREEEIRQRRQQVAALVERARERARLLFLALDEHVDQLLGASHLDPAGERAGGDDVERLAHEQVSRLRNRHHVGEQIAHGQHGRKALEDRHEAAMLLLSVLEVDDVVVKKVFAGIGRDREELRTGQVDEHRAQPADL